MTFTVLFAVALVPVVAAYLIACFRNPVRYALPPYAVSLPFSSLISVGSGPFGSASSVLGVLLGVTLVFQLITTRRGSPGLSLAVPVWLAFLALCALSLFWSIAPTATVTSVLVLGSSVLLFVALAVSPFGAAALRLFENSIVLGGILVVCYGLAQLLFLGGLPSNGGAARFGNDLLDPNNQASALLLPLAITAWRTLSGSRTARVTYGVAVLMLTLGILMTGSRGGFLAAVVVFVVVVVFSTARRASKAAFAVIAAVFLVVILVVRPGDVGERQLERGESSSGRSDIWEVGLHACRDYCLFGAGWGGFPTVYRAQLAEVPEAKVQLGGVAYEPHNILLLAVVEAGALGLVLVVLGLGIALTSAFRLPRSLRGPPAAALLGNLVASIFLSNLEYKFYWAMLAYIVLSESVAAAEQGRTDPDALLPRLPITARDEEGLRVGS